MKSIYELDLENKTVILRCDYNVSIKDNKIVSDERIVASLDTINYLLSKNAKIIIMSHLGKIKTLEDKNNNSLYIVYERLSELVNAKVIFSSATSGKILEDKIASLNNGEILLMENTRFEDLDNNKESNCDPELSKYWASLGDCFVNDAFGMSHRRHASNYGISKYLDSAYGLLIEKELKGLELVVNPDRPFVVFMGGAKIEDKLDIIKMILPKCDYLLVGGGVANSFINCNYNVGLSLYNNEKKDELLDLLNTYKDKIILPVDVRVLNNDMVIERELDQITDNDNILDLGTKTVYIYKDIIDKANTIFLNGTAGKYEDNRFEDGTKEILNIISSSNAKSVVGGGDAISSMEYFNIKDFTFVSTGGGATLEYIATGKLNCFD